MKTLLILTALSLPLAGVPGDVDPFRDTPHCHVRIEVRHIEIPSALLPRVIEKKDTYVSVGVLLKQGKCAIISSEIMTAPSDEKATCESIRELIFPTETQPPIFPGKQPAGFNKVSRSPNGRPPTPTAFETRNLGHTLEIEPTILDDDTGRIALRIDDETVTCPRFTTWQGHRDQNGSADVVTPEFEKQKTQGYIMLEDGKFLLFGSHTTKTADGGLDPSRKILVFVRATVITP